ncbi:MAG TPA: hypothetical protein VMU69_22640 [Bradyrhizobium sp.]|nr:hypothetical protein [Bradyrhizobium sp.]
MNFEHLKKDVGYRVKLVPPAYHLDAAGELLPVQDEDWIIMVVTNDYVEINTASGHFYRLGKDHVRSFTTDPHRSTDGLNHGFLQLHVQLYMRGADVTAVPNHQPGAALPPPVNLTLKARATFVPELERVFRRQVQILDRVLVNFSVTANDMLGNHQAIRPGDTWESLRPVQPRLFPHAAVYRDLSESDAELLAEFYGAVSEVADLIEHWAGTMALTEYNAWNVLMHKAQHSLRMGEFAVRKLCPDRAYDATMPTGGTLLLRSQRVLTAADKARAVFLAKFASSQQKKTISR